MGDAQVERFQKDVSGAELVAALERDGCAIVEGAMQPSQLEGLNRDLDTLIHSKPSGVRQWEAEVNPPPAERDKPNYSEGIEALSDAFVSLRQTLVPALLLLRSIFNGCMYNRSKVRDSLHLNTDLFSAIKI